MERIDFNHHTFTGFSTNEKIMIDTGVILALTNKYDAWHNTVKNLFENFILQDGNKPIFLFINPTILNEITHLAKRPFENFSKANKQLDLSNINPNSIVDTTVNQIRILIENEILLIKDGNKESALKQIQLYKVLGSADAVNISISNQFEINFLTVDVRLSNNVFKIKKDLEYLPKVYYTTPRYRSYR